MIKKSKASEIKKLRNTFQEGKIKKIYEISDNMCIIKFKPKKNTLKFLPDHTSYYYTPANLYCDKYGRFLPPWYHTSIKGLLAELIEKGYFIA